MKIYHHQNVISRYVFRSKRVSWKSIYVAIEAHSKKMIYNQNKNANVFQFQAGCMTHPMMKNIRHIESGLSRYFYPHFKTKQ